VKEPEAGLLTGGENDPVGKDGMQALALSSGDLTSGENDPVGKDGMQALAPSSGDLTSAANERTGKGVRQGYVHARDDPMNDANARVEQVEMLESARALDLVMSGANDPLRKAKNRDSARDPMSSASAQEQASGQLPGASLMTAHRAAHDRPAGQVVSALLPGEHARAVENHLPGQSDRAGSDGSGERSD
jgi:hypothetical protein